MGWVDDLGGKTVGLDTAPLIFYIEAHSTYGRVLDPFFEKVKSGDIQVVTSVLTLIEVLVHALRRGEEALAHLYNDILLSSPHIATIPVTTATAQAAAELRATHNLKTPDAIQLATAVSHDAEVFLTNDRDFDNASSLLILKVHDLVS